MPACHAKDDTPVQMPEQRISLNLPVMSNTILKTSIPAFDAKDQTEGQMPHTI